MYQPIINYALRQIFESQVVCGADEKQAKIAKNQQYQSFDYFPYTRKKKRIKS